MECRPDDRLHFGRLQFYRVFISDRLCIVDFPVCRPKIAVATIAVKKKKSVFIMRIYITNALTCRSNSSLLVSCIFYFIFFFHTG